MDYQVLRIKDMELPVPVGQETEVDPKIKELQEKFLSGKELTRDQIARLIINRDIAKQNGNCWGC
jgi:uncharacterized coiled-coil DUF342 family protein